MKRVFIILAITVLFTGCYKSELTYTTHPDEGKVEIKVILPAPDPETGEPSDPDATTPDSYTLILNGEEVIVGEDGVEELPYTLEPDTYTVYSNTDEMNIENNINENGGGTITSSKIVDAAMVESLTEDLYFGTQTITVLADQFISSEVVLSQVTRTIRFNLNIIEGDLDDVVAVSATMGGIASQWECVEDIPFGDIVTIAPDFEQGESLTKAATNDYLTSSIKVLGTNGDEQILNLELTFTNGNTQIITSDVSDKLEGSNHTKSIPITLSGNLKVNTEFGATGTITDWVESGNDETFDAFGRYFSYFFTFLWSNSPLLDHKCGKKLTQNLIPNPPNQFLEVPKRIETMKKIILSALALLTLASCSKSDDTSFATTDSQMRITSSIATRTTGNIWDGGDAIAMVFDHKLARIALTIKPGGGLVNADLKDMKVTLSRTDTEATYNLTKAHDAEPSPITLGEKVDDIEMKTADTGLSAQAIIIPQSVSVKLTFNTADGNTFTTTIPDTDFAIGQEYLYSVTIKNSEVSISSPTINDWGEGNGTGDDLTAESAADIALVGDTYQIATPAGLQAFASIVNNETTDVNGLKTEGISNTTITKNRSANGLLLYDIDLSTICYEVVDGDDVNWTPIGAVYRLCIERNWLRLHHWHYRNE